MSIFLTEYREKQDENQSVLVHAASTEEKAVAWIQEHGKDGWCDDDVTYYFAVFEMQLDCADFVGAGEGYLCYYDRFGNKVNYPPLTR